MPRMTPVYTPMLSLDHILYEDDALMIVSKPAGLPSQATRDPQRAHLLGELAALLTGRDGEPPYLALHHRLDVETSGAIALARAPHANAALMRAFQHRLAAKVYIALCHAPTTPLPAGRHDHLAPQRGLSKNAPQRMTSVRSGGDYAHTALRVITSGDHHIEVEARPSTGRRHQIRAHLGALGAPLLGDPLYGGLTHLQQIAIPRVMLHAARLTLPHPITGEPIEVCAPEPDDMRALRTTLMQDRALQHDEPSP